MLRAVSRALNRDPDRQWAPAPARTGIAALVGSVLIHLGLAVFFLHFAKPVSLKITQPSASVEIEIAQPEKTRSAPERPANVSRPEHRIKAPAGPRGTAVARTNPAPASGAANDLAAPSGASVPAGDVPAPLDLTLHGSLETASPGGTTVHNLPGEIEPLRKSLAKARIDAWIAEDSATRRVDKGLVDDWFAGLHKSLDRALESHPPPLAVTTHAVAKLLDGYGSAAANYGATGNPGEHAMTNGLANLRAEDKEGALGAALGPAPVAQLQLDPRSVDVWAVVELSYDLEGALAGSRVLDSSGNREFNLHVLKVVALGLPGLPDLPDGGDGIHPDGTRSVWRVRGHVTFERDVRSLKLKDAWALPLAAASTLVGLGGVHFDETSGYVGYTDFSKPHMKCEVELLKVY
jgi:hypothetical protein